MSTKLKYLQKVAKRKERLDQTKFIARVWLQGQVSTKLLLDCLNSLVKMDKELESN